MSAAGDVLGRVVCAASPSRAAGSMAPVTTGRWRAAAVASLVVALAAAAAASVAGPYVGLALIVLDAALAALAGLILRLRSPTPGPLHLYPEVAASAATTEPAPAAPAPEAEPGVPEPEVLVGPSADPEPASPTASVAGSFAWGSLGTRARPEADAPVAPSSVPFAGVEAAAHLTPVGPETPWITERPPAEPPEEAIAALPPVREPAVRPSPAFTPSRAGASRLDLSQTPALRWGGPAVPRACVGCGKTSPGGPTTLSCARCGRALCADCYWGAPTTAGGRRCPECRRAEGAAGSMARSGARRADRLSPRGSPPGPPGAPRRR